MNSKPRRVIAYILAILASLFVIVGALFLSLDIVMGDEDWFSAEYEKLGTAEEIGISNEDMTRAIMQLVKYMRGSEGSIDLEVSENGETVSMYNERERLHMLDVRVLFQTWRLVCTVGAFLAVLFCAAVWFSMRSETKKIVSRSFLIGGGIFTLILAALGIYLAVDFNAFWTSFHHLFFTNDLWLLSYATDRMIRICPGELFFDIIIRFGTIFVAAFVAALTIAAVTLRSATKKRKAAGKAR